MRTNGNRNNAHSPLAPASAIFCFSSEPIFEALFKTLLLFSSNKQAHTYTHTQRQRERVCAYVRNGLE